MTNNNQLVSVLLICRKGVRHEIGVWIDRPRRVPPELLRDQHKFGQDISSDYRCCQLPENLTILVHRELDTNLEFSRSNREVLIKVTH